MYNIHSHYQNIWSYLKTIIADPRVLYLIPFGSTQPENLERLADARTGWWPFPGPPDKRGPMFIFYDQEPIYGDYNHRLLDHIRDNYMGPFILVTTEKNSHALTHIQERYGWPVVYYFHHAFAAHDWFRGSRYDARLVAPENRHLLKKFISFNRITGSSRVYRSLLLADIAERNLLEFGYVSYNDVCPEGGDFAHHIQLAVDNQLIQHHTATKALATLRTLDFPLRIDFKDEQTIPNHSFNLSAVQQTQESFCYLVTETCFWEHKCHLTEKIFKPIISKMPFILAGPAHNLKYLREYGFKTFDQWFDESYDDIDDSELRLQAMGEVVAKICSYTLLELAAMLVEMKPVLDHNYNLYHSHAFLDRCWDELTNNLNAVELLEEFRIR